ncbi:MAG: y domain 1 [Verrucomicrobiota bacterium]|jgi:hypothetical protein
MQNKSILFLTCGRLCLLAVTSLFLTEVHARTWTSADGTKTFEGEFLSYDPATGAVGVTLTGGKVMKFSQDKLSAEDIAYLKAHFAEHGNKEVAKTGSPVSGASNLKELPEVWQPPTRNPTTGRDWSPISVPI